MFFESPEVKNEFISNRRPRGVSMHRMDTPMLHRDDNAESAAVTAAAASPPHPGPSTRRKSVTTKAGTLTFVEQVKRTQVDDSDSLPLPSTSSFTSTSSPKHRSVSTAGLSDAPTPQNPENVKISRGALEYLEQLPKVTDEESESMNEDIERLLAQLTERETLHACDVLETMLEDDEDGFHEELFVYCRKYLRQAKAYDRRNGTQIVDFEISASTEMERDVQAELLVYDTLPLPRKIKIFLEHPESGPGARAFYGLLSFVVVLSCACTVAMTMPQWNPSVFPEYSTMWTAADWLFTVLLTFETVTRFTANVLDERQGRKTANALSFLRKPGNIADIAALSPTYIQVVLASAGRVLSGTLRTARLLRLLKFLRRYQPVQRLVVALARSVGGLIAPFCFLGMSLLLFASTVFYAERGNYDEKTARFMVPDPSCANQPVQYFV